MEIQKGTILINVVTKQEWRVKSFDGILVILENITVSSNRVIERHFKEVKNEFIVKG